MGRTIASIQHKDSCITNAQFFLNIVNRNPIVYNYEIFAGYADLIPLIPSNSRRAILNDARETAELELEKIGITSFQSVEIPAIWVDGSQFRQQGLLITKDILPSSNIFSKKALKHPLFRKYLMDLNERGYRVAIDPSLGLVNGYGKMWQRNKIITILPNAPWEVFVHEYEHTIFNDLVNAIGFDNIKSSILSSKKTSVMIDELIKDHNYSKSQATYLAKLIKKKVFSQETINESLSVERELDALRSSGSLPWSYVVYKARQYRWSFQLEDLAQLKNMRALSTNEKLIFWEIQLKRVLTHPLIINGTLVISAIYFSDDLKNILIKSTNDSVLILSEEQR